MNDTTDRKRDDKTKPKPQATPPDDGYANLNEWMTKYLAPIIQRRVANEAAPGMRWCAQWHQHAEVLHRCHSLWREWEKAHGKGNLSEWWITHLDAHLATLTSPDGPMRMCSPTTHEPSASLPITSATDTALQALANHYDAKDPDDEDPPTSTDDTKEQT